MLNELGELNLLLLEKIYSTFENKADKVYNYFRKDKYAYLWPRLFKYVGENILDRGKGVDNANDDTFVLDGDNEIKNIFRQDEVEGDRNEGLVDYDHLNEEDIPLNLWRLMQRYCMTVDEARRYYMKWLDSDLSLNFDTELEANLRFIDHLLG